MKILPPTNCPSCDSVLIYRNDQLYCISDDCSATGQKRVEHFAKTLKIKGLGPAAIEKLNINRIEEIYQVDIPYATISLGSAKLAVKLCEEIQKSKNEPLDTVLPAFGIPLVGKTASEKLSKVCKSIFDIDLETCKQAGLGTKASSNLIGWIEGPFTETLVDLPFTYEFEQKSRSSSTKGIICISGKLSSFKTKAEATKVIEELGYSVKDSLTKDVTILVNESGRETDKTQKARASGITIVTNLKEFLENN